MRDARLIGRVPGIVDEAEVRFRPPLREFPGSLHRTNYIIAALHNHGGYQTNPIHTVEQLILVGEKSRIHEIVTLDSRQRDREFSLLKRQRVRRLR